MFGYRSVRSHIDWDSALASRFQLGLKPTLLFAAYIVDFALLRLLSGSFFLPTRRLRGRDKRLFIYCHSVFCVIDRLRGNQISFNIRFPFCSASRWPPNHNGVIIGIRFWQTRCVCNWITCKFLSNKRIITCNYWRIKCSIKCAWRLITWVITCRLLLTTCKIVTTWMRLCCMGFSTNNQRCITCCRVLVTCSTLNTWECLRGTCLITF